MTDALLHFACLVAGAAIPWFGKRSRKDPIALGLGIAMGVSVSFAIREDVLYLIAVPIFGVLLLLRHFKLRQGLADVRQ